MTSGEHVCAIIEAYCKDAIECPRAVYRNHDPFTDALGIHSLDRSFFEGVHLYSRANAKLNRAAALAEWRQLLSA